MWGVENVLLNPDSMDASYVLGGMALATFACIVVFVISVLFENGVDVFGAGKAEQAIDLRRIFMALLFIFMIFGSFVFMTSTGGFLYANF